MRDEEETPEKKSAGDPAEQAALEAHPAAEPEDEDDGDVSPDLENRVLCSDGACIGVIGSDGRCKVCGGPGEGAPGVPETGAGATAGAASAAAAAATPEESSTRPEASDEDDPPDLSSRTLCSDGACIGVIGPDGRCKVCGLPYSEDPGA